MSKQQPESIIKTQIKNYLETIPNCEVFPIQTTGVFDPRSRRFRRSAGRRGCPDLIVLVAKRFIAIEVKTRYGKVSPEQQACIDAINKAGGYAFVARSVQDVILHLQKLQHSSADQREPSVCLP